MKYSYMIILFGFVSIASCKKDNKDNKPTLIFINVQSADGVALNNVSVKLLTNEKHLSTFYYLAATSGADGKVNFIVEPDNDYYLYHYEEDHRWIADSKATFIVTGKFTTQQQINNSPGQTPAAQVGDDIHLDINTDGVVDKYDRVLKISAKANSTVTTNFTLAQ